MKNKVNVVKRLESIKVALELEDYDVVELHVSKIKQGDTTGLNEILTLLQAPHANNDKINKLIENFMYSPIGNALTPHQQEVFDAICLSLDDILRHPEETLDKNNNFVSLTGFAGVGKTFLTSKLIEYFIKKQDYKVLLTTPTHKSLAVAKYMLDSNNLRVPTTTLQSYLDIKLFTDLLKGTKVFKRDKVDAQLDYEKNLDILIVDESSMISNELLEFITENLFQSKLKSVLFIGDPFQLPPIDEGQNGIETLQKQYKLTEVLRQAQDSYVKKIAIELKDCIEYKTFKPIHEIFSQNKYPQMEIFYEDKEMYDSFCASSQWFEKRQMVLSFTNSNVDSFNRLLRARYWAHHNIIPQEPIIEGEILVFNENYKKDFRNSEIVSVAKVFKKQNSHVLLELEREDTHKEALVYFECRTSNGRVFKAVHPDQYSAFNKYLFDLAKTAKGREDKEQRKALWGKYFSIKEEYADLKYKFSSTIHKSQGSTYDTVYLDLSPIMELSETKDKELAYRLLYVATTRAAKDIKIFF